MRVAARVLLFVVGGLLLVVGVVAAFLVGPDDTVVAGETEASGGTAYTARGLFNVAPLTVEVSAEAEKGEVFVGVGHPVDVSDVVAGHDAFRIFQVNVGSLAGTTDDGEEKMPDPRGIGWIDSVSGEGEQSLSYAVDELSPQFLVYSPSGSPVTASVGFSVPGTFRLCVVVAVVGVLLVVGAAVLLRRRRPRPAGGTEVPRSEGAEAPESSQNRATPVAEAAAGEEPAPSAFTVRRRVAAGLGAVSLLALSGCGVVPEIPQQMASTEATKVALEPDDLDELWADYDKRYNAANKAAYAPKYDASKLMTVDTGIMAEWDRYKATWMEADSHTEDGRNEKPDKADPIATTGDWVSAPEFGSYPMWAVVDRESVDKKKDDKKDGKKKNEKPKYTLGSVVVKEAVDEPWKPRSTFSLPAKLEGKLPEVAPTPTKKQVARAEKVAAAMNTYMSTGKKPAVLGAVPGLKALRKSMAEDPKDSVDRDDGPASWSIDSELFDDESVRVIPTDDVLYALIDQRHTIKVEHSDSGWHWTPPSDAVNGDAGSLLYSQRATTVLARIPVGGKSAKAKVNGYYSWPAIADGL